MKIYEIGTGYTPIPAQMGAATEIVVEELTCSFSNNGENTEIIDISALDRKECDLKITEVNVPRFFTKKDVSLGIVHKVKRVIYSVCLASKLKKILKNNQASEKTVFHFHNQYNLFFFLKIVPEKLRKNALIAYTNHSYIWHGEWKDIENTVKKRYFQEIYAMKRADCVFILNSNAKHNIINHCEVPAEKIYLIKNGVNTENYTILSNEEINKYKSENSLSDKEVFIQVGSVCERKNQLESLKMLLPYFLENEKLVFCYAGGIIDDDYYQKIIKFAEENGIGDRVKYFGELPPGEELNKFYNMAKAMLFPSTAEGFSLTVIEAMAAGVPVIIPDSLNFKLAEKCLVYSNKAEFENVIEKTDFNSIREKVRNCVEKEYSWNEISKEYLAIFKKYLKE